MSKKLVAYFSASGVTASLAKNLAAAEGADQHPHLPGASLHHDGFLRKTEVMGHDEMPDAAQKQHRRDDADGGYYAAGDLLSCHVWRVLQAWPKKSWICPIREAGMT